MNKDGNISLIGLQRNDALVAGLSWHAIVSSDLRQRERLVDEFVQANGVELMCVLENPHGLQIGWCQKARLPLLNQQRSVRWLSLALLVRKHFQVDRVLLVWRSQDPENQRTYAVQVFEEGSLLLDRVVDRSQVEEVVTTYLENTEQSEDGQFLCNDPELFPEFTDISALDWLDDQPDAARLRPPRRARLIDAEKRPVQAFFIVASLVAVSVAMAWYVWSVFIAKPQMTTAKPKVTPQAAYLRKVTEQIGALGWRAETVRELMMEMMTLPVMQEGWQLMSVTCDHKSCGLLWSGLPGADPRPLEKLGEPDRKDKRLGEGRVLLNRKHKHAITGVVTAEKFRSKQDAKLFCQREAMILRQMKLKNNLDCRGSNWPEKAGKLPPEIMVERYSIRVQADWITLDHLLDRYADGVFWREVRLLVDPAKNDIADVVQFEVTGDLYGYR